MAKKKTLTKLVYEYEISKEISESYVSQLLYAANMFSKHLGRNATIKDMSTKRVNRWLKSECDQGRVSSRTRANVRKSIMTLSAYSGCRLSNEKIRKVKVPKQNPQAWTKQEFQNIVDASKKLKGKLKSGVPRALYFETIFWFGFETGLRRRDIWSFDCSVISNEGKATVVQNKTLNSHTVQLSKQTVEGIKEIQLILQSSGHPAMQPLMWTQSEGQFYYWAKRIREIAGVDPDVANRSLQHLRRTGATQIALDGGVPWQYLGHTEPGLDLRSYVDGEQTSKVQSPKFSRD